ncbi:MAG TPA: hypothetical protein PK095_09330 [Myxococcota bacterium]|nr:hypothetical protein [Myxococcota bacterium]
MTTTRREPRSFYVVLDDVAVLQVEARAGHLRSMAPPPEGWTPPTHPFVDASSLDPTTEDTLREHLDRSSSFEDFAQSLIAGGFDLMSRDNDTWSLPHARRITSGGRVVGALWAQPGHYTSLTWQPQRMEQHHSIVTAYSEAHADALLGALATSGSLSELETVLVDMGFQVAR